MLHAKKYRHSIYSPEFYDRCTSLFFGFESGHMGSDMYSEHNGMRNDGPMSGVKTWEEHAKYGTIPHLTQQAIQSRLTDIADEVGEGLPIIEYGPGSMQDARRLIQAIDSTLYIPADISEGIINQASELQSVLNNCAVKPEIIDLFASNTKQLVDEPALAALLGLTITNIPGPVPTAEPKEALIRTFRNLKRPISNYGGYLLISTHAEQDGEKNKAFYNEKWHKKFGVNFLYRMQQELPMDGFNPDYFEYLPMWYEHCSLLAHTVRATRDQSFTMGEFSEIKIHIKAGDIFHSNNSFKYRASFFETCAAQAGLKTIRKWEDNNQLAVYLFEVAPAGKMQIVPKSLGSTSLYSLCA